MDVSDWKANQTSTSVTVDEHELEVAYVCRGNGPPLVFLHGIPTWSFLWRDVIQAVDNEYTVFAIDMPGYGNSSKYDGFDRSIRAQEAVLDAFLEAMGLELPTIVGHDIGGGVALRYASHQPDRISKLVLSNATAYDSWPIESILRLGLPKHIESTSVEELRDTLATAYRQTLFRETETEPFVEGMLAQVQTTDDAISMGRNAIALNTNHTTEIDYGEISAETLLLWGAHDDEQPIEDAERLRDDLPRARLVGLEEANHWVTEDRPTAYRDALREFLI